MKISSSSGAGSSRLSVRVGIHTGLVIAGEIGAGGNRDSRAVGKTLNLAARLQAAAESNAVLISDATFRIVRGQFECQAMGELNLKGISEAVSGYRVLHHCRPDSPDGLDRQDARSAIIGREREISLLLDRWELATARNGQVVVLSGEAGIGKSRLLSALRKRVTQGRTATGMSMRAAPDSHLWLEFRASAYSSNSAFRPIIDLLERILEFDKPLGTDDKLRKLNELLERQGLRSPENAALLADAELLYQRGLPPNATYTFKHALIQGEAYHSALKRKRREYHRRLAETLESKFSETARTQPELLAYHLTEAGLPVKAVGFWLLAGQRAVQTSAKVEAVKHFGRSLELIDLLPEGPERVQLELALQLGRGVPLLMTRGYGAPVVQAAFARAPKEASWPERNLLGGLSHAANGVSEQRTRSG